MSNRQNLHRIIFGTDTKSGQRFDIALIYLILASVVVVLIESISGIPDRLRAALWYAEVIFTLLFTVEYAVRIYVSPQRLRYIFSFWGIVDLFAVIPGYLAFIYANSSYLLIVRLLRVLRVFRVFRLFGYLSEANVLMRSLKKSHKKILVFACFIVVLATLFGSLMYLVEGPEHGFTSIPKSIYWTIVTITTVGYGDITPQTSLGQIISSIAMLLGYSIFAVPTGIVAAHLSDELRSQRRRPCSNCGAISHDEDALFCKACGIKFSGVTDQFST